MRGRTAAMAVLCGGVLLAGCQSTVPGTPSTPSGSPTSTSTVSPSASAAPTKPPPGAQVLPDEHGYSFIATKSGETRCQLSTTSVGCEAQFANAPQVDGGQANGVEASVDGTLHWLLGNLGDPPVVTLDYRTYAAQGWTIVATEAGTRFTNDRTGHGMFVSIEKVESF
jgi:hypothetical protein